MTIPQALRFALGVLAAAVGLFVLDAIVGEWGEDAASILRGLAGALVVLAFAAILFAARESKDKTSTSYAISIGGLVSTLGVLAAVGLLFPAPSGSEADVFVRPVLAVAGLAGVGAAAIIGQRHWSNDD